MGVRGILPKLKSITNTVNISKYKGKVAGIDISSWMYKGAYGCCVELCQDETCTFAYADYCMERLKKIMEQGVRVVVVFDGATIGAKRLANENRKRVREKNKRIGLNYLKDGNSKDAFIYLSRSVQVTKFMKRVLMERLRKARIDFIVAPYEADAQLAYMSRHRAIDVVVSEDSDCIPFGCITTIFKLNEDGIGYEIRRSAMKKNEEVCFNDWTSDMIMMLCVLAGCDYCPNIANIGFMTAYKLVSANRTAEKLFNAIQKFQPCDSDYTQLFSQAVLVFYHQRVYDPFLKKVVHLTPIDQSCIWLSYLKDPTNLNFLGPPTSDSMAEIIATAQIDPFLDYSINSMSSKDKAQTLSKKPSINSPKNICKSTFNQGDTANLENRVPNFRAQMSTNKTSTQKLLYRPTKKRMATPYVSAQFQALIPHPSSFSEEYDTIDFNRRTTSNATYRSRRSVLQVVYPKEAILSETVTTLDQAKRHSAETQDSPLNENSEGCKNFSFHWNRHE